MNAQDKPVVLVTAVGAPPGLNALRALVEAGSYRVVAGDAVRDTTGLYQYGVPAVVLPMADQAEAYLDALVAAVFRHGVQVVIPCIEDEVRLLSARRDEVERATGARILLPPKESVSIGSDKWRMAELCMRFDVPCPASLLAPAGVDAGRLLGDLKEFAVDTPFPWIVKPTDAYGMRGVKTVFDINGALSVINEQADSDVLIQEKIPGAVGSMYMVGLLYDGNGCMTRQFTSRSIRTLYPEGGPATGGVSLNSPELVERTKALVEKVGPWAGPLGAEWMLDPRDRRHKFIEINPRPWGYGYLAVASGVNFPALTAELALGRDIGPDPGFKTGKTLLRATCDLIFSESPFPPPSGGFQ